METESSNDVMDEFEVSIIKVVEEKEKITREGKTLESVQAETHNEPTTSADLDNNLNLTIKKERNVIEVDEFGQEIIVLDVDSHLCEYINHDGEKNSSAKTLEIEKASDKAETDPRFKDCESGKFKEKQENTKKSTTVHSEIMPDKIDNKSLEQSPQETSKKENYKVKKNLLVEAPKEVSKSKRGRKKTDSKIEKDDPKKGKIDEDEKQQTDDEENDENLRT